MGPRRSILNKYEQLDANTKRQFNQHFLNTLQQATSGHKSIGQFIQQSTTIAGDTKGAMDAIFPPTFYTYGEDVINEMNKTGINNQVEDLLQKFAPNTKMGKQTGGSGRKKPMSLLAQEEQRIQRELQRAKQDIDAINQEVEDNLALHEQIKEQAL